MKKDHKYKMTTYCGIPCEQRLVDQFNFGYKELKEILDRRIDEMDMHIRRAYVAGVKKGIEHAFDELTSFNKKIFKLSLTWTIGEKELRELISNDGLYKIKWEN